MGKVFKIFGILFFLVGVVVMFNSFQSITGYAVYEDVNVNSGYYVSAWFILLGILLIVFRKKEEVKRGRTKKN